MGLFDDVFNVAAGFRAQAFDGLGYEAVWSQLKPWLANISANGVVKWLPKAALQVPCRVPKYQDGIPVGACQHVGLASCLCCGSPVCLTHSFVDAQGEVVCYLCVVKASSAARPFQESPQPPPPPPPPDPAQELRRQANWARMILGIQEGVPWESVKRQHRTLSAQFHPDRPSGNEAKFKDVQKAFEVLRQIYGEK